MCSNNSEKDPFSVAGRVPLLSFYASRDNTVVELKAGANRGPFEKIAFQGLNACGLARLGPLAVRTFTHLGQGSALTTSTNGRKDALWWIREPDEKCCYKLVTKAPKDRGEILVHFQLQTAKARKRPHSFGAFVARWKNVLYKRAEATQEAHLRTVA